MTRVLAVILAGLLVTPAFARDITVILNDQQQASLMQLLDLGVKQGGLAVATNAAILLQILQQAAQTPPQAPDSKITPDGAAAKP